MTAQPLWGCTLCTIKFKFSLSSYNFCGFASDFQIMKPVLTLVKRQISLEMADFMFLLGRCGPQCLLFHSNQGKLTYVQQHFCLQNLGRENQCGVNPTKLGIEQFMEIAVEADRIPKIASKLSEIARPHTEQNYHVHFSIKGT